MLKNLAKPSTMASETHPSSFKQLSYTQHTARPSNMAMPSFAGHVTARESFVVMLQPKNHSWHVTAQESVLHFDHYFHPTLIDGTYCPTIQDGNPISCQSHQGLRICRRHVRVQESVVNALQPEFGHCPIPARESVCFLGRTSKSRSHASDILFFMRNSEPYEYFLCYVYKQFIYIKFRKFIFIRRVRSVRHKKRAYDFKWQRRCFPLFAQKMYLSTCICLGM
jgi:hypothetical protein